MGSGFKLGVRCMIFGVRYSVSDPEDSEFTGTLMEVVN